MLELLISDAGKKSLVTARMKAADHFEARFSSGELGDSKAWFDITLLGPNGAYPIGDVLKVGRGRPTLGQEAECIETCKQMRQRSIRTSGLSCRDAEELGDTRRDDETYHLGNVVVNLTPGGTYKLIVSVAGPHDRACEEIATFMAEIIETDVRQLLQEPQPTPAMYAEYAS